RAPGQKYDDRKKNKRHRGSDRRNRRRHIHRHKQKDRVTEKRDRADDRDGRDQQGGEGKRQPGEERRHWVWRLATGENQAEQQPDAEGGKRRLNRFGFDAMDDIIGRTSGLTPRPLAGLSSLAIGFVAAMPGGLTQNADDLFELCAQLFHLFSKRLD